MRSLSLLDAATTLGASLLDIAILAFVLYFVIKVAVRKAIIEAKVYEPELTVSTEVSKLFVELTTYISGSAGLGTEIFHGLTKEQKNEFKPEWKEIGKRYSKLALIYYSHVSNQQKFKDDALALKHDIEKIVQRVEAIKNGG